MCDWGSRAPTEISNSVVITSFDDLEGERPRCEQVARKAREASGARRISFVPTISAQVSEGRFVAWFTGMRALQWGLTQGR